MITELANKRNQSRVSLSYDYNLIGDDDRDVVRGHATDIKLLQRRASSDIVKIGRALLEVRERLDRGDFLEWIETEFGWSSSQAYAFIKVTEKEALFGNVELFGPSALYLLAEDKTPDQAIEEAKRIAAETGHLGHKQAKQIVDRYKKEAEAGVDPKIALIKTFEKAKKETTQFITVTGRQDVADRLADSLALALAALE